MSQSARPTSLTTTAWSGAYTDLTDESDLTFIESSDAPIASETFLCPLSALTDPVVHTEHKIRVRALIDPPGGAPLELVLLLENTDDGSIITTRNYVPSSTSYSDQVFTLTEAEAALVHSYSGLRVRGYGQPAPGGGVAFVWSAVDGADTYILQIGTATTLSDVFDYDVGNVLTYTRALATGTYYCRVVPVFGEVEGDPSTEQVVTV